MRRILLVLFLLTVVAVPGCRRGKPPEERVHHVYGTVQSISAEEVVVETRRGEVRRFVMGPASIRGSDFGEDTLVNVYYRQGEGYDEVTMVVEVRR